MPTCAGWLTALKAEHHPPTSLARRNISEKPCEFDPKFALAWALLS